MLFPAMLLAHLLADYPLQPNWLVARKRRWPWLFLHGAIVLVTSLLLLAPLLPRLWLLLLLISCVHVLQDWLKLRVGSLLFDAPVIPYLLDQGSHVVLLGVCALLPDIALLAPALPQSVYGVGIVMVLLIWTFPITLRVARAHVAEQTKDA